MSTETPESAVSPASSSVTPAMASPGSMLAEARERARMSIEDLSAHTKLSRPTLEALERDDYGALLEPVYVRGYYRKCAKILEIDEERLIAAYAARVSQRSPGAPSKLRLASGTELGSSSRVPLSMALIAAVVVIIVCAVLWSWRQSRPSFIPVTTPVAESPQVGAGSAVGTAVPPEQVLATPSASADAEQPPAATEAAPGAAAESAPTTPSGVVPGSLHLVFKQNSWVRIDDAAGKTLLNEMLNANSERTVNGQLPLSVFLGNAPGVTVEYEGHVLDVAPFTRGNNTARFSVPQE